MENRAIEVTSSTMADAPVLPDLLGQIAPQEQITSVTTDGAYDTLSCHDAIAAKGTAAVTAPQERRFTRQSALGLGYGVNGADITDEAAWRQR